MSFRTWWNSKIEWFRDAARPLKGWRTVIINAAMAVAVVLVEATNFIMAQGVEDYIPTQFAHWTPWIILGVTLINIYLRLITTTKVGYRDEETPTISK